MVKATVAQADSLVRAFGELSVELAAFSVSSALVSLFFQDRYSRDI